MDMMDQLDIPQPKQDDLNDVTLIMKHRKELTASRNTLLAAGPFFFALLNSDMRENKEGIIRLEHITDTVMRDVLEFMHSGTVEITSTNAQELVEAADYFLLPTLKTIAGRFLKDNITTSNCISIYYFADKYQCDELVIRKAKEFILSNFDVVAKSEDFLNLEAQQVEEWISSDEIAICSENEVIKIILTWIERSRIERKGKLEELFRHVRLPFVSRDYLKRDVVTNHLVKENSSCLKLLRDAMKKIRCKTDKDIPQSPGRNWQHTHLIVLAGNVTLCYNPEREKWYQLESARRVYKRYNLLSFQGKLHVFPHYEFCQSERYDTRCDRWVPLNTEKSHLRQFARLAAVVGAEIYAIDYTWKGKHRLQCHVMKCNVESDSWQRVSSLSYDECWRGATGACVVAMDHYLYVIGGLWSGGMSVNGPLIEPIAYAVRFNTIEERWEKIASMQCARYNACGVAARGKIFIAGGVTGGIRIQNAPDDVTGTCETYNVSTNEWQFIASLHAPRKDGSMVYLKGSLYVVGGALLGNGHIPSEALVIESYDFERNTWKPKTKIPILSSRPISNWNDIQACTLTVNEQVLKRPVNRPLAMS